MNKAMSHYQRMRLDCMGQEFVRLSRNALEAIIMLAQGSLLNLVDDGEHTSDVLAHNLDLGQLRSCTTSDLPTAVSRPSQPALYWGPSRRGGSPARS